MQGTYSKYLRFMKLILKRPFHTAFSWVPRHLTLPPAPRDGKLVSASQMSRRSGLWGLTGLAGQHQARGRSEFLAPALGQLFQEETYLQSCRAQFEMITLNSHDKTLSASRCVPAACQELHCVINASSITLCGLTIVSCCSEGNRFQRVQLLPFGGQIWELKPALSVLSCRAPPPHSAALLPSPG